MSARDDAICSAIYVGGNLSIHSNYSISVVAFEQALRDAGYAVVPMEPTEAMHLAGNSVWGESVTAMYRVMIAAADAPDAGP